MSALWSADVLRAIGREWDPSDVPKIAPPDFLLKTLARQLGGPSGVLGGVVAKLLNKGNAPTITAAVDALGLTGGENVADVGFGGGLGLGLLLTGVGPEGTVHGIEPSTDMINRARKNFPEAVAAGRLVLNEGTMDALPVASGSLDGWISLNTVYFIPDLTPAFADLTRVLSPTGVGVLGVADPDWLGSQPLARHGFTVRPIGEVVALLEHAGLTVEQRTVIASKETGGGAPYSLLVCRHG